MSLASDRASGRAALVTGGSSGIGLEIARALGAAGYAVTIVARRPEKLEQAAAELRGGGVDVLAVAAQMGEEAEVVGAVGRHRELFGRLDVLVNNAGVGIAQPAGDVVTKHLDMQLSVNLRSAVIATRECLPMLRESGADHRKALVVNMSSISGKEGWPGLSVYSATKAGLVAFSAATQKEVAGAGIQVTALCPGLVDTAMAEAVPGEPEEMIRPTDIADAVLFLLGTSPTCHVPELAFAPAGGNSWPQ